MKNIFRKGKKNHQNSYKKIAEKNDFSSIEEAKKLVKEDREIYHRDTFSSLYFPCNQKFKY